MHIAIDDVRLLYSYVESLYASVNFGDHPPAYAASLDLALYVGNRQAVYHRTGVIWISLNAIDISHRDELARHQRSGDIPGHSISVKI